MSGLNNVNSKIEVIRSTSAKDFLEQIGPNLDRIGPPNYFDPWVFRGHYDAGWDLSPPVWRKDGLKTLEPLRELLLPQVQHLIAQHPPSQQRPDAQKHFEWCLEVCSEVYAVREFCDLADELGMLIPNEGDVPELAAILAQTVMGHVPRGIMIEQARLFVDIPFGFAQHHGIPTRYLDWTRDPYVAAFFATEESKEKTRTSDEICVWAADLTDIPNWGPAFGSRPGAFEWVRVPRAQNSFLHAQSGVFLFCGRRDGQKWFEWPGAHLKQFTLPVEASKELRALLFGAHRVSKAHLMPTFDNVVAATEEKWLWHLGRAKRSS